MHGKSRGVLAAASCSRHISDQNIKQETDRQPPRKAESSESDPVSSASKQTVDGCMRSMTATPGE